MKRFFSTWTGWIISTTLMSTVSFGAYNYLANRSVTNIKLTNTTATTGIARNIGVSASVGSNALTVNIVTQDGSTNASSTSPVDVWFRNATATTGAPALVSLTGALTITVPTTATLGHPSGVTEYVWIYELNDAGTPDICLSGGDVFFNDVLNSSTQISSGATSGSVLYCASAHTGGKPTVIVGRLLISEATAGTWASPPTRVDVMPVPVKNTTTYSTTTNTITGISVNPTKGSIVNDKLTTNRDGQWLYGVGAFQQSSGGTSGTGDYLYAPGGSCSIDSAVAPFFTADTSAILNILGEVYLDNGTNTSIGMKVSAYDATHVRFVGTSSANTALVNVQSSSSFPLNVAIRINYTFRLPCVGWWTYGP